MPAGSHRRILQAALVLGGSSAVQILIGILRTKLVAIMIGPAGAGLIGVYSSLLALLSSLAGLGLSQGAIREIAADRDDPVRQAVARRTLLVGSLGLGVGAAALVLLFSEPIAAGVVGDAGRAGDVRWIALGVFLTVVAAGQTALVNALRPIGELAAIGVVAAFLASILGVGAVALFGLDGAIGFVVAMPAATVLAAGVVCLRLPKVAPVAVPLSAVRGRLGGMLRTGGAVTIAAVVGGGAQVAVRAMVTDAEGLEATGHFQAAWTISMQYVGFVLGTMAVDYYPRLSAAMNTPEAARRLVNEQTEVALLLAAPVLIAVFAFAAIAVPLLFSADFAEAVPILKWQIVGDVFKLAAWPLGFLLLARGASVAFVLTDAAWAILYIGLLAFLLPQVGLVATGSAFALAYAGYFALMVVVAGRDFGQRLTRRNALLVALTLAAIAVVALAERVHPALGLLTGLGLSAGGGLAALLILANAVDPTSRIGRKANAVTRRLAGLHPAFARTRG
ncbi:O-antigen translocase [Mongoliimonas terrestris]|uniref:O-antigen translocase n=1 Tax=Mongoliimonas terrestris TaxID=1709001 RepID=UPI000949570B|nr:O-antigen translocase [Mongoliimonas terrestris]